MKGILAYNRRLLQRSTAVRLSSLRPPNVRLPSIRHYTFKVSEVDIDEVPLNQYHSIADGVLEEIVDELETIGETKPDLDVELNVCYYLYNVLNESNNLIARGVNSGTPTCRNLCH